jgi:hypothetical protein
LEAVMSRLFMRTVLWISAAFASAALLFGTPFIWPDPLFAFSVSDGKITVKSDRPIPTGGGTRLLHDCEMLLDRSPLKANGRQYDIYVTNGYVPPPPRTLAFYCGHELTHLVEVEHGFSWFEVPRWVWEGFGDYVGIENRPTFEQLHDALGDRPAMFHDDKVWQLSAIPPARHVLHGEKGVVCGSAIPIETDRR